MSSIFFLTGIFLVKVSVTAAANTTACRCKIITKVECGVTCDDYYSPMPEIDASNPADGSCTILSGITCPENYNVFFSKNDVKTVVAPGDLEAGRVQTTCSRENGWTLKDAKGAEHSFTHVGCDTCRCGIEASILCAGCPAPQFTFSYPPTSVCAHIASVTCPPGYDTLALFNQHTSAREDMPANSFSSMMSTYQCYTNGTQSVSIASGAFVFTHIGCLPGTLTTTPKPTCPCKTFKVKSECGPTCDDYTSPPPEIETEPGVCSKLTNLICPSHFNPFVSKGTESTVIPSADFENGLVHGECEVSSWKLVNSSGEKVEFTHVGCRACSCGPEFLPVCMSTDHEPIYDCPNATKPTFTYGYPPSKKCIHPERITCPGDYELAIPLFENEWHYMPTSLEAKFIYYCLENGTMAFTMEGAEDFLIVEYVSCYPPPPEMETTTTTPTIPDPCDSCVLPQVMPLDMCPFFVPDSGVAHAEFNVTRNGDKCELTTSCDIWHFQFEDGDCTTNMKEKLICEDGRYKSPLFNHGVTHIRCKDGPAPTPAPSDSCDSCVRPQLMPADMCSFIGPLPNAKVLEFNVTKNGNKCELTTTNCKIWDFRFDDGECSSNMIQPLICEDGEFQFPDFPSSRITHIRCAEEERPTPSPDPCDSCILPQQMALDVCSDLNPNPNSPPVQFNVTKNGDTCQLTTNCKIWQTKYENDDDCVIDVAETLTCKDGYYKGLFEEGITHIRCDDAPKPTPAPSDPCDSCVLPQVMPLDMCSFLVPDSGVAHAEFNVTRNGDKCELTTDCNIWQWQFEDGQCANNAAQTLICEDGRYKSPIFNLGITHIRCEDGPAPTSGPSDPCDCPLPEEMPPEVCTELPPPTGEQPAVQFNVTRNGKSCELTTNCQFMQIQFDDDEEFCGSTLVHKLICENGRYIMPPFDQPVKYMRCDNAN